MSEHKKHKGIMAGKNSRAIRDFSNDYLKINKFRHVFAYIK